MQMEKENILIRIPMILVLTVAPFINVIRVETRVAFGWHDVEKKK